MSLQLIPSNPNIDFVGKRYIFVAISTLINLAAIVLLFTVGLNYGVDFAGGSVVQLEFSKTTDASSIRAALEPLNLGELTVQDFGAKSSNSFLVRLPKVAHMERLGPSVESALTRSYGAGVAKVVRVESVGAKVGSDLRQKAFLAVIVATVFMGVFIAWQFRHVSWSFGVGAVIALIHDVMVVIGALVITQLDFDLTTLAALITVIGYSVHDTIIVSDRVREDSAKRRREPLESMMNRAINETLSRTILTSGTAISVLAALLIFGGPILRPSAFTLLIGFITGVYST
ncbi:MAG: protein translocase subunit SecF, partial [Candidatus Binataceae bacterium]